MAGNKKQSDTMKQRYGENIFEALGAEGGKKARLSGRTYFFQNRDAAKAAQAKGVESRRKRKEKV